MALTLRDLTSTTLTALGTVPNGISNVAEGLETYAVEWKRERSQQMLKNRIRRGTEVEAMRKALEESGLTLERIQENERWVKEMLKY